MAASAPPPASLVPLLEQAWEGQEEPRRESGGVFCSSAFGTAAAKAIAARRGPSTACKAGAQESLCREVSHALRLAAISDAHYGKPVAVTGYGIGAYSPAEAGRLLQIPPATIRHWLFGYSYDHHGPRRSQPPLWRAQYGIDQDEPLLGFRDLLEARIVRGLRVMRLPLPVIRQCLNLARDLVEDDHPFSTRRFQTDGRTLFIEQGGAVLDLRTRQHVFRHVIAPTFKDLEFDTDAASRWWLNPKNKTLVIDPERSWGQPIVAATGVSIDTLVQAVEAEGSIERAALLFELPPATVRDALAFKHRRLH